MSFQQAPISAQYSRRLVNDRLPTFVFQAWYCDRELSDTEPYNQRLARTIWADPDPMLMGLVFEGRRAQPRDLSFVAPISIRVYARNCLKETEGAFFERINWLWEVVFPIAAERFLGNLGLSPEFFNMHAEASDGVRIDKYTRMAVANKVNQQMGRLRLDKAEAYSTAELVDGVLLAASALKPVVSSAFSSLAGMAANLTPAPLKKKMFAAPPPEKPQRAQQVYSPCSCSCLSKHSESPSSTFITEPCESQVEDVHHQVHGDNWDDVNQAFANLISDRQSMEECEWRSASTAVASAAFPRHCKEFKNKFGQVKARWNSPEGALDSGLETHFLWKAVSEMSDLARIYCQLLRTITSEETHHEAIKDHQLGAIGNTTTAIGIACGTGMLAYRSVMSFARNKSGWGVALAGGAVAAAAVAAVPGKKAYGHFIGMRTCRKLDDDCETFRQEFGDLMRVTALCFAASTGYAARFKYSPDAKESFLKSFGVDLEKVGQEEYQKEQIKSRVRSMGSAYETLAQTLDIIEKS
ncbi:hypothetical protein MAPG_09402 [Magnaporthiopsis poae ATCC 64411]|uniref:Uncharacterized protein n=1 Tax=Magnaporthiopsis poae (strain ATCC 64411 / 73-15) TaxID=644358 RepID=A0A0C4E9V2_MAGP6|nr:hypothetical protein MAPG_09402 [Magnaporthiopsis poae ATCC 64411]